MTFIDKDEIISRLAQIEEQLANIQERIVHYETLYDFQKSLQEELEFKLTQFDDRPIAYWD